MRLVAYGLSLSVILILVGNVMAAGLDRVVAQAVSPTASDFAPPILQGSALAILGGTLWYMLTRTFPAHTAALKEQRESFLKALQDEHREAQAERVQTFEVIERIVGGRSRE